MKSNNRMVKRLSYALFALLLPVSAVAEPTTAEQAEQVVRNWLALDQQPLGANLGTAVEDVQAYNDENDHPLYYVVNLSPKGFVIVAGDDYVEPIIAFIPEGEYESSDEKPLGALVSRDVPGRVQHVRAIQAAKGIVALQETENSSLLKARKKWDRLKQNNRPPQATGVDSIDDVRVAPFLASKWGQAKIPGTSINLYNLHTPNNYIAGCVATALSQVLWYFQHSASVGTGAYTVYVGPDSDKLTAQTTNLLGGDGAGSAYNWSDMPAVPDGDTITDVQKDAIGRLLHDAGAAVCMKYTSTSSGASVSTAGRSLLDVFGYSNAVQGAVSGWDDIPATERNKMTNPNLDAGYPVIYGIRRDGGGHAGVCDGYGYNDSTMYHHINMGWDGHSDAWYNLPVIDPNPTYTTIDECIYNIYTSQAGEASKAEEAPIAGEIISGRVTDLLGKPIPGVSITAALTSAVSAAGKSSEVTYTASTNAKGIYALKKVPSASTYTITASKEGHDFSSQTVSTGISENYFNANADPCANTGTLGAGTVGNVWGVDFSSSSALPSSNGGLRAAYRLLL